MEEILGTTTDLATTPTTENNVMTLLLTSSQKNSPDLDPGTLNPDPVSKETLELVDDIFTCHAIPVVSLLGIVGNFLSFVVLVLQKRAPATNMVLAVLAVVDTLYLLFQNLDYITCVISQSDVIAGRNFGVLLLPQLMWIGNTLSRLSGTLTMVIAVERCIVVKLPLKVKALVTPRSIYVTTGLALVIPALMHIPVFMRGEIEWVLEAKLNLTLPYLTKTAFARQNAAFLDMYKNLILNVLFNYIPVAVVIVCTAATIQQLRRYSRWRQASSHAGGQAGLDKSADKLSDRDTRVSITLMRVCVLFIVCSTPFCVLHTVRLIEPQFDFYGIYSNSFNLTAAIREFLSVVNSSANFLIYMKSGNDFKRTLFKVLRATVLAPCSRLACCARIYSNLLPATTSVGESTATTRKNWAFSETGVSTTDCNSVVFTTVAAASIVNEEE